MAAADEVDVPLLVRLLAGNVVTGASIFALLDTVDATRLRRLHPAVAGAVAGVPWADTRIPVYDLGRMRAALPGAVGARLTDRAAAMHGSPPLAAALTGIMHLDLRSRSHVTDDLILSLPPSLRSLDISGCDRLTTRGTLAHLPALTSLRCRGAGALLRDGAACLPPSLQELDINSVRDLLASASLEHLTHLRVLRATYSSLCNTTLATLPAGLVELHLDYAWSSSEFSFAHFPALRTLSVSDVNICDESLASLPPSLCFLDVSRCAKLTSAAALPHLPALRKLNVSETGIGDRLVASLPPGLEELRLTSCQQVTRGATLDHLPALRALFSCGTDLHSAALAACRERGCVAAAAGQLVHELCKVRALAVLAGGRLACGTGNDGVWLWDVLDSGRKFVAWLRASGMVAALAALPGGRLAIGMESHFEPGRCIQVWDVACTPPACRATVGCSSNMWALAVLADGRLAVACDDGKVQLVDVDAAAMEAVLEGHRGSVRALAVLPDGALASGSIDHTVRVWDVGARTCVATLTGHLGGVRTLAVLADGRLASGSGDGTVRLWEGGSSVSLGEASDLTTVVALVALPDGRLVSVTGDGTVQLWDTRAAAAATAASTRVAAHVPAVVLGRVPPAITAAAVLPDCRLAIAGGVFARIDGVVYLLAVPPPPASYD